MLKYKNILEKAAQSVDYWAHLAKRVFVRDLNQRMDVLGMKRADLARSIESSTAYVTKVMRGDANLTLETMTKLAMAVNGRIEVRIVEFSAPAIRAPVGRDGWQFDRAPGEEIAGASAMLKLAPHQLAANEQYGNEMQFLARRCV